LEGEEKENMKEQTKREEGINQRRNLWATDRKIGKEKVENQIYKEKK
jgi:hypothetical protein